MIIGTDPILGYCPVCSAGFRAREDLRGRRRPYFSADDYYNCNVCGAQFRGGDIRWLI